jgi:hypothetical protein
MYIIFQPQQLKMPAPSYISSPWDLDPIGDPIPPITIEEIGKKNFWLDK